MYRSIAASLSLICLLGLVVESRANPAPVRPPKRPELRTGPVETTVVVQVDASLKHPKLVIPANLLTEDGKAPGSKAGASAGGFNTIFAGLALTGAFVSGGFWLTRNGRGRGFAAGLALALLLVGGSLASADLIVPPRPRVETIKLPASIRLPEKVTLSVGPRGDSIKLLLPSGTVEKKDAPKSTRPSK